MKKKEKSNETTVELMRLVDNLASQINELRNQITSMPNTRPTIGTVTSSRSNIIPFPGNKFYANLGMEQNRFRTEHSANLPPILAMPGRPLGKEIPDCRPMLQRDGLILLAWDKRDTEMGEQFTAYWVTSAGIPRFYASKPFSLKDLKSAYPDHKSYAAEDGIEFYGQSAPAYIVHVAPELMMSSPKHKELRTGHINLLKKTGSRVNFNYKFLLKTEKLKKSAAKKSSELSTKAQVEVSRVCPQGQAC